jgi:predicted transposase YbfD/YdcC
MRLSSSCPKRWKRRSEAHSAALAAASKHVEDCIAVDGKALKGSFDAMADRHAAQWLRAFTHTEQVILGHIPIAEKSNEIPAAQKLIEELGLKGRVFTLDAELLVKKTFEVARSTGSHLIVQVKGNQPKLLKQVKALASEAPARSDYRQFDHKRQRIEWREVRVFAAAALPGEWDGLIHTVIEVRRTRNVFHPNPTFSTHLKNRRLLEVSIPGERVNTGGRASKWLV